MYLLSKKVNSYLGNIFTLGGFIKGSAAKKRVLEKPLKNLNINARIENIDFINTSIVTH